ncbi:hypothetical protein PUN28_003094 [Cardiocondyla obscurior]|uniref:Uncharacterized protein n=1 Tax=Cardiocondyla obscurior TaxID=286306 RepID=A0AAW2GHS7_9HYME
MEKISRSRNIAEYPNFVENITAIPGVKFHVAHTAQSISRARRKRRNITGIPSIIPIVFSLITRKLNTICVRA